MSILLALLAAAVVELILRYGFDASLPGIAFIGLYLVFFYVIDYLRKRVGGAIESEQWAPSWGDYPVESLTTLQASGPIARFGKWALVVVFFSTQLLIILNPFQLIQVLKQLAGNASLSWREKKTKDNLQHYETQLDYRLPFDGEWLVLNGGMTPSGSHSWDILGQRYALDFVKDDGALVRHSGRGTQPEDYLCYGVPILAAQSGVVVAVESRIKDAPLLGWGVCDITARSFIGNYVMIEHADQEFGLYAHLQPGSVLVEVGERVVQGQPIGACGHTGHSTEPHLHFHLQDSPDPYHGMGLPVAFSDLVIGNQPAVRARLRSGHRVSSVV
ncbi:MAG: M23 family metallopeptidase [Wenzhouxiangella sp.]|nr:M23 family metallopeptidase [Wenzhouxiangella sp.]